MPKVAPTAARAHPACPRHRGAARLAAADAAAVLPRPRATTVPPPARCQAQRRCTGTRRVRRNTEHHRDSPTESPPSDHPPLGGEPLVPGVPGRPRAAYTETRHPQAPKPELIWLLPSLLSMRPLFAIAPLALLLAITGPRPVRWDAGEQARQELERASLSGTASAPEQHPASERTSAEHTSAERTPAALRTSGRAHMGVTTLTAEGPFPHGRAR